MNSSQLKQALLEEHIREKKISKRNFIIMCVVSAIALVAAFYFVSFANTSSEYHDAPRWLILIYPGMALSLLSSPGIALYNSNKASKTIDMVLEKLDAGEKATNIHQEEIYKTTIPLLKIDFKLNPFQYLIFYFGLKSYKLPVPVLAIPDVKAMLSGANMQKINDVWNELYTDGNESESTQAETLKPVEEFSAYAKQELEAPMETMEKSRKKTLLRTIIIGGAIFLAIAIVQYIVFTRASDKSTIITSADPATIEAFHAHENQTTYYIIGGFLGIYLLSFGFYRYQKQKAKNMSADAIAFAMDSDYTQFKPRMLKKIIHFINPSFEYIEQGQIGLLEVIETGMFDNKYYDVRGNDLIVGKHSGVPFQSCDLMMTHTKKYTKENEGPDVAFSGQYFVAKFNKKFNSPVYVYSKSSFIGAFSNNDIHTYINTRADKVTLEDPEFMKLFDVYCDDQVTARYILTPSIMEQIKTLAGNTKKGKLFLAFNNNKVSVLQNTGTDKFETGMYTKLKPEMLTEFYTDLRKQFSIINELKLNVNIWKKPSATIN